MEVINNLGQIEIFSKKGVIWRIPNFYDLPQSYDTVIRSPRFNIDNRDWYMEVYPNGRRLYCSLGWFGIRALNFNSDSCVRGFCYLAVYSKRRNCIVTKEETYGDGSYCCTRLLPASLLKSWRNVFVPKDDLYLTFSSGVATSFVTETIYLQLRTDDVQKLFQNNFENACVEASVQAEVKNEIPMESTVGELGIDSERVEWVIPNFFNLLQTYDNVARSPRFHYKDSDWYMEVYPSGRSLDSTLGWFGVGVCNLNPDATLRFISVSVSGETYNVDVRLETDSQNKGFYSCSKLLPTSLFKFWQDVIAPDGNLHLYFPFDSQDEDDDTDEDDESEDDDDDDDDDDTENSIISISKETMRRWYEEKFKNADTLTEASTETEEEIGVEKMKQDLQEILLNGVVSDIVESQNTQVDLGSSFSSFLGYDDPRYKRKKHWHCRYS